MMIPTNQTTLFHILKGSKLHYKKQLAILKKHALYDIIYDVPY